MNSNNNFNLSRRLLLNFVSSDSYLPTINSFLKIANASISETDSRMPDPPFTKDEADNNSIAEMLSLYLGNDTESQWWRSTLKKYASQSWDLISTCTIDGKKGLLLVEAKAKKGEIRIFPRRKSSYEYTDVNNEFRQFEPYINLSTNKCPQLSRHIVHSWAMAKQDLPVVLLYLCFRFKNGHRVFKRHFDWKRYLINTARFIGAHRLIDTKTLIDGNRSSFTFLCGSVEIGSNLPDHSVPSGSPLPLKYKETFTKPKFAQALSTDVMKSLNKKLFLKNKYSLLEVRQFRKAIAKKPAYKRKYSRPSIRKTTPIEPKEIINKFEDYITSYQSGRKQPAKIL